MYLVLISDCITEAEEVLQERGRGALGTERILMMHVYVDIDTKVKLQ